jgi:hypothetical protein
MALDPKKIAELEAKLKSIEEYSRQLGKNINTINLKPLEQNAGAIEAIFEQLNKEMEDLGGSTDYLVSEFSRLTSEIRNTSAGVKQSTNSMRELSSIAQKLSNHQKGYNDLSKAELNTLSKKVKQEYSSLSNSLKALQMEQEDLLYQQKSLNTKKRKNAEDEKALASIDKKLKTNLSTQNSIEGVLSNQNTVLSELTNELGRASKEAGEIETKMGVSDTILKGMQGTLGKLGLGSLADKMDLGGIREELKDLAKEQAEAVEKEKSLTEQLNSANKRGLSDKQIEAGFGGKNLKNLLGQKNAASAAAKGAQGISGAMNMAGTAAKLFGKNLMASMGPIGIILMVVEQVVEAFKMLDSGTGDMAKNLNISYEQATDVQHQLGTIADLSADSSITQKRLGETLMFINKELGTSAMINEENLKVYTKLREQAGMTNEEIMGIAKFTEATGGDAEKNVEAFQKGAKAAMYQKGIFLNTKTLMADMGKLSKSQLLLFKGNAGAVGDMLARVKATGMEMSKLEAAADSLLNFEQSIENELSAELLTGKSLNLEKARSAALSNDMATLAEELKKQNVDAAKFAGMNRIEQEAMAKAMGMSKEELADVLYEQEALNSLGKKGLDQLSEKEKEAYLAAKEKYGAEKAAAMIKSGELENMVKQQSLQERFNQSVEKLKEIFVRIAEPVMQILDPIMQIVDALMPLVNVILKPALSLFQAIGKAISTYIMEPLNGVKEIFSGIMDLFSGNFADGIKKIGTGMIRIVLSPIQAIIDGALLLINDSISLLNKIPGVEIDKIPGFNLTDMISGKERLKKGDDVMSSPGYGKRTLLAPEGAIQLNNNDTVIAGTNLFGDDVKSEPGKRTQMGSKGQYSLNESNSSDMSQTNELLKQMINLIQAGSVIQMDSQKVGEALRLGTRQIQ